MTTLTSNAVHWQCYLDHTRYICIKNLKQLLHNDEEESGKRNGKCLVYIYMYLYDGHIES